MVGASHARPPQDRYGQDAHSMPASRRRSLACIVINGFGTVSPHRDSNGTNAFVERDNTMATPNETIRKRVHELVDQHFPDGRLPRLDDNTYTKELLSQGLRYPKDYPASKVL